MLAFVMETGRSPLPTQTSLAAFAAHMNGSFVMTHTAYMVASHRT